MVYISSNDGPANPPLAGRGGGKKVKVAHPRIPFVLHGEAEEEKETRGRRKKSARLDREQAWWLAWGHGGEKLLDWA